MKKENFRPNQDERPGMIVFGICVTYLLVLSFIYYFYFMHKISLLIMIVSMGIFTLLYVPRFLIISKLKNKTKIKIVDTAILINGNEYKFSVIKDFKVNLKKPKVVFVLSNNLVIFQEAEFYIFTEIGEVSFDVIGSEKIDLLCKFLSNIKLL